MASQGPLSGGTFADDATVGTVAWTNPSNAGASDDVYAVVVLTVAGSQLVSHYLKATNFGFSIPTGATINGIVVEIERKTDNAFIKDNAVRIIKGGNIGTTDKSLVANWSGTEAYFTYGSSSDLWGETWTADDINASTFGVGLSVIFNGGTTSTNSVDHIRITVYYTAAVGGGTRISTTGRIATPTRIVTPTRLATTRNLI